jgi:hypothetical protein
MTDQNQSPDAVSKGMPMSPGRPADVGSPASQEILDIIPIENNQLDEDALTDDEKRLRLIQELDALIFGLKPINRVYSPPAFSPQL